MKNGTTTRERDQEGLMDHCDYTIYTMMRNTAWSLRFGNHCSPLRPYNDSVSLDLESILLY